MQMIGRSWLASLAGVLLLAATAWAGKPKADSKQGGCTPPGEGVAREGPSEGQLGVEVLRVRIGSGPDDIGFSPGREAESEGPTSFALAVPSSPEDYARRSDHGIYVLDHVNARVQVFKNKTRVRSIPIPPAGWRAGSEGYGPTFKDLDVAGDGKFALLDDLMTNSVYVLAADGTVLHKLPLAGEHIPSTASGQQLGVEGVHWRDDGIWVERAGNAIRIADADGKPTPSRVSLEGTFTLDGKRLKRLRSPGISTAVIHLSEHDYAKWRGIPLTLLGTVHGLDGPYFPSPNPGLFLVALDPERDPLGGKEIVVLNSRGKETRRINLPASPNSACIERALRVSLDGGIYHMTLEEQSVVIKRYDP